MSFFSATIDAFRGFAARSPAPRTIEKRIYVFVLVPTSARGNGQAKRADFGQRLANTKELVNDARIEQLTDRAFGRVDFAANPHEPKLNYDLMWTWFLPNPLWPPKRRK